TGLPLTSNFVGIVLPRRRRFERALGERAGQRAAIGGAGVDVLLRLDFGGRRLADLDGERFVDGLAVQRRFRLGQSALAIADADDADMGVGGLAALHVVIERDSANGEVAAAAGELLEAVAARGWPRRQMNLGDDFVGFERRGQRALEEIGRLDVARAALAHYGDFRIAGLRDAGHFGGRIGVGAGAADGAAVANLIVPDVGDRFLQERMRRGEPFVVEDVAPAHQRTEPDAV